MQLSQGSVKESCSVGRIFRKVAKCARKVNLWGTWHCDHTLDVLWWHDDIDNQNNKTKNYPLWVYLDPKATSATLEINLRTTVTKLVQKFLKLCVWVQPMFTWLEKIKHTKKNLRNHQKRTTSMIRQSNMPKDDNWSSKHKGWKDFEGAHGMSLSVWKHKGKTKEGSKIWVQA